MSSVQIVGAGYVGSAIARHFSAEGQRVTAITRTGAGAQALQDADISPVVVDLTQPRTLASIIPAEYVVISVAPDQRDEAGYREVYVDGVGNYLQALKRLPQPLMMIYLSSTGVWGARDGESPRIHGS